MENRMTQKSTEMLESTAERATMPPRADVYENKDEYLVVADVPGASSDSLSINLDNERLTIAARAGLEAEGTAISQEFEPVDYYRSFLVPEEIDRNKISADLKQGVLYLHLPKSETVKPRRIEVKAG